MSGKVIYFADNLIFLRKQARWTQAELASSLKLKPNTISNYEKNISSPAYDIIHKLMKLFDVSADELLYKRLDVGAISDDYDSSEDSFDDESDGDTDDDCRRGYSGRHSSPGKTMKNKPNHNVDYSAREAEWNAEIRARDIQIKALQEQLNAKDKQLLDYSRRLGRMERELEELRLREAFPPQE